MAVYGTPGTAYVAESAGIQFAANLTGLVPLSLSVMIYSTYVTPAWQLMYYYAPTGTWALLGAPIAPASAASQSQLSVPFGSLDRMPDGLVNNGNVTFRLGIVSLASSYATGSYASADYNIMDDLILLAWPMTASPAFTATSSATASAASTSTSSPTSTTTPSSVSTATSTRSTGATPSITSSNSATASVSSSATPSGTFTPTASLSSSWTPSATWTSSQTASATATSSVVSYVLAAWSFDNTTAFVSSSDGQSSTLLAFGGGPTTLSSTTTGRAGSSGAALEVSNTPGVAYVADSAGIQFTVPTVGMIPSTVSFYMYASYGSAPWVLQYLSAVSGSWVNAGAQTAGATTTATRAVISTQAAAAADPGSLVNSGSVTFRLALASLSATFSTGTYASSDFSVIDARELWGGANYTTALHLYIFFFSSLCFLAHSELRLS